MEKKLFKVVEICGKTTVALDACKSLIDEKIKEFNAFFALSSIIKSTRNGRRNTGICVGLCFIVLTENLGRRIVSSKFILRHLTVDQQKN
jgi:hypothetical protein